MGGGGIFVALLNNEAQQSGMTSSETHCASTDEHEHPPNAKGAATDRPLSGWVTHFARERSIGQCDPSLTANAMTTKVKWGQRDCKPG